jgi:hypothetical protein
MNKTLYTRISHCRCRGKNRQWNKNLAFYARDGNISNWRKLCAWAECFCGEQGKNG